MLWSKDIEWQNGYIYKKKTYLFAAYKRPSSDPKSYTDWKWRDEKTLIMQIKKKKKPGEQYLY